MKRVRRAQRMPAEEVEAPAAHRLRDLDEEECPQVALQHVERPVALSPSEKSPSRHRRASADAISISVIRDVATRLRARSSRTRPLSGSST